MLYGTCNLKLVVEYRVIGKFGIQIDERKRSKGGETKGSSTLHK
jgi:hypothetical protein